MGLHCLPPNFSHHFDNGSYESHESHEGHEGNESHEEGQKGQGGLKELYKESTSMQEQSAARQGLRIRAWSFDGLRPHMKLRSLARRVYFALSQIETCQK